MERENFFGPETYIRSPQILLSGDKHSKYVSHIIQNLIQDVKKEQINSSVLERVTIQKVSSEWELIAFAEIVKNSDNAILLLDSEGVSLAEAQSKIYDRIGFQASNVCAAVPSIESWMFSDIDNAIKYTRNRSSIDILRRISTPEEIAYPKQLAYNVFLSDEYEKIFSGMNLRRACESSPSLTYFVNRILDISMISKRYRYSTEYTRSLDLDIIANLLREVSEKKSTVYRSLDGHRYTAEDMIQEVSKETAIGKEYASNLLRIARDFIARKSSSD